MAKPAADKRHLSVLVTVSDLEEIDRIAAKVDLTRSELVRNILQVGLDQVRMFDKVGAFSAVKTFRHVMESMQGKASAPDPKK